MINVGICDDDYKFCHHLEKILYDLQSELNIIMNIEIFYDDDKFMKRIKS